MLRSLFEFFWRTVTQRAEALLRAQSELKASESLVWSGVPNARHAAIAAIPETIVPGIALVGFALLWMVQVYDAAGSALTPSQKPSPVLGTVMFALALLMAGLCTLQGHCGFIGGHSERCMQ